MKTKMATDGDRGRDLYGDRLRLIRKPMHIPGDRDRYGWRPKLRLRSRPMKTKMDTDEDQDGGLYRDSQRLIRILIQADIMSERRSLGRKTEAFSVV